MRHPARISFLLSVAFRWSLLLGQSGTFAQGWSSQVVELRDVQRAGSDTLVAVGERATVMRSDDGGLNWSAMYNVARFQSYFNGTAWIGRTGVCVGEDGLIVRTTDSGTSWTQQLSGTTNTLLEVISNDMATLTVVGSGGVILQSLDSGLTWIPRESGTLERLHSVCRIGNEMWAVGDSGTLLYSADDGVQWVPRQSSTTIDLHGCAFYDPLLGVAVGGEVVGFESIILRTTNGGMTWSEQFNPHVLLLRDVSFADRNNWIIVGGEESSNVLLRSTDEGRTWYNAGQPTGEDFFLSAVAFLDSSVGLAVGSKTTIVRTTNSGASWIEKSHIPSYDWNSVFFLTADTGWAVGGTGGQDAYAVLRTNNGGVTWKATEIPASGWMTSVFFIDPRTGWASASGTSNGAILHTTDGGETWSTQWSGGNQVTSVFFTDAANGWASATGGSNLLRTTDGGASWVTQVLAFNGGMQSIFFANENTGWIVGTDASTAMTYRTTNRGESWLPVRISWTYTLTSVFFTGPLYGWVVGEDGVVSHSTNGGATWQWQAGGLAWTLESIHFVDPNRGWTVGGLGGVDGKIYFTNNGGLNWTEQLELSGPLYSAFFYDANTGWAVGDEGEILHTTTGGTEIEPPGITTLSQPLNGSTESTAPTLIWNPAAEALWYTLQVSTNPYFTTKVFNETNIATTSYQVGNLVDSTTYYWRVSWSDSVRTSGWSERWSFTVEDNTSVSATRDFPAGFSLSQNYPNPFNPTTVISYSVPLSGTRSRPDGSRDGQLSTISFVRLQIYDLLGREVATLLNEIQDAGYKSVEWDATGFPSGLYFYRLSTPHFVQTRKLILLR